MLIDIKYYTWYLIMTFIEGLSTWCLAEGTVDRKWELCDGDKELSRGWKPLREPTQGREVIGKCLLLRDRRDHLEIKDEGPSSVTHLNLNRLSWKRQRPIVILLRIKIGPRLTAVACSHCRTILGGENSREWNPISLTTQRRLAGVCNATRWTDERKTSSVHHLPWFYQWQAANPKPADC